MDSLIEGEFPNFDNEIIYKSNSLSYFKIDKDTVYYGINFDF